MSVMVAVSVMVGVAVGVDVLVGVNVRVGVGVSVANKPPRGLFEPLVSQTISRIKPRITKPDRTVDEERSALLSSFAVGVDARSDVLPDGGSV